MPEPESKLEVEHEAWLIDTAHASVAAVWLDGTLWLAGDRVHGIVGGVGERVAAGTEAPPGYASLGARPWTRIVPEAGARYVVGAGATQEPDPTIGDREALLDRMLDVPPAPAPGMLTRLLGRRNPPVEAAVLVIDLVEEAPPGELPTWLAELRARDVDLSWIGNEGGPGLVHAIRRPLASEPNVRAALLAHAREDAELTELVREHAEVWIEDGGGDVTEDGRLVPDDPTRGWIEHLELDAIADGVVGGASAWMDPGTNHARPAWRLVLPGATILAALRRHVEEPTIVGICSAPVEAVLMVHLIGGIDRGSNELVGFALQRVWT